MPQNVEDGFVRAACIHDGAAEMVPVEDANAEGFAIEADRLSTHTVVASNTSTLAFESNGGSAVEGQEVEYGEKLTKPVDPIREGFVFEGWYIDEELTNVYNFEEPVTVHLGILYAKWTEALSESAAGKNETPQTGDSSALFGVMALGAVSLLVALYVLVCRRV